MTPPSRTDIPVSLVIIGGAFVAGSLVTLAAAAVAYGAIRGCGG